MILRKRLLAVLTAFAFLIGVSAVTATPAQAAGVCPSGYACFYEHTGYNGSSALYSSAFYGQCVNLTGFWHDRISSMKNNIGYGVTVYQHSGCGVNGGWNIWMYNGLGIGDAGAWGANDSVDSIYFG